MEKEEISQIRLRLSKWSSRTSFRIGENSRLFTLKSLREYSYPLVRRNERGLQGPKNRTNSGRFLRTGDVCESTHLQSITPNEVPLLFRQEISPLLYP